MGGAAIASLQTSTLGEGYWGRNVKARHMLDGRVVAVKMLLRPYREHRDIYARELKNLARLPSHANLVRYFHCWLDEDGQSGGLREADRMYIVTEFIRGQPLCDAFGTELPTDTILAWAEGLYSGLAAMHAIPMWHRDLHGANVLVELEPDGKTLATRADAIKVHTRPRLSWSACCGQLINIVLAP